MTSELFNFSTVKIGDKSFITASRWREGFTIPEVVIVREVSDDEAESRLDDELEMPTR